MRLTAPSDISEERGGERELLENLPSGTALFELDGDALTAVYLNKRYWELVGRTRPESSSLSAVGAIHPDDISVVIRSILSALTFKRDAECDIRILYGENEYRPIHIISRIIPREGGNFSIYASYTPITHMYE